MLIIVAFDYLPVEVLPNIKFIIDMEIILYALIFINIVILFITLNNIKDTLSVINTRLDAIEEDQFKLVEDIKQINENITILKTASESITLDTKDSIKIIQSKSDILNNNINAFKSDFETAHSVLMESIKAKSKSSRSTTTQKKAKEQPENCR